jgi:hypothetical protein
VPPPPEGLPFPEAILFPILQNSCFGAKLLCWHRSQQYHGHDSENRTAGISVATEKRRIVTLLLMNNDTGHISGNNAFKGLQNDNVPERGMSDRRDHLERSSRTGIPVLSEISFRSENSGFSFLIPNPSETLTLTVCPPICLSSKCDTIS